MKHASLLWFFLGYSSLITATQAAEHLKPGLWEMSTKMDSMKAMPKIPPEQLEQLKKMGIAIPESRDGAIITKVCFDKQMAERDPKDAQDHLPPEARQECKSQNFSFQGASYSGEVICNGQNIQGKGTISGKYGGDSMSSVYDFNGVANGKPMKQHIENQGKWLSADCGNVRPVSDYLPKKNK